MIYFSGREVTEASFPCTVVACKGALFLHVATRYASDSEPRNLESCSADELVNISNECSWKMKAATSRNFWESTRFESANVSALWEFFLFLDEGASGPPYPRRPPRSIFVGQHLLEVASAGPQKKLPGNQKSTAWKRVIFLPRGMQNLLFFSTSVKTATFLGSYPPKSTQRKKLSFEQQHGKKRQNLVDKTPLSQRPDENCPSQVLATSPPHTACPLSRSGCLF